MKAFLFDIDGTLIQTSGLGRLPYKQALLEIFSVDVDLKRVEWLGRPDLETLAELTSFYGISSDVFTTKWSDLQKVYFSYLSTLLQERSHEIRLLPGVLTWLNLLSEEALGIVTGNLTIAAELKLKVSGLKSYFPDKIGGFGEEHPDRGELVRKALQKMQDYYQQPFFEDVWIVGDSHRDILCAKKNHLNSLAVATGKQSIEKLRRYHPTLLIGNLTKCSPQKLKEFPPTPWSNKY